MAFLTLFELFDIAVMSLIVGFIFKDSFRAPVNWKDPDDLIKNVTPGFGFGKLSDYWFAVLLVAPSIIVHEFGHKFTALAFGLIAEVHAAYLWLGIGVLMKLIMPGFVFFVPAFTSIVGNSTPLQEAAISFAGPVVNLLFWFCAWAYLKYATGPGKRVSKHDKEKLRFLALFRYINGFLFIFNLIPIPGFDGYSLFYNLGKAFGLL